MTEMSLFEHHPQCELTNKMLRTLADELGITEKVEKKLAKNKDTKGYKERYNEIQEARTDNPSSQVCNPCIVDVIAPTSFKKM